MTVAASPDRLIDPGQPPVVGSAQWVKGCEPLLMSRILVLVDEYVAEATGNDPLLVAQALRRAGMDKTADLVDHALMDPSERLTEDQTLMARHMYAMREDDGAPRFDIAGIAALLMRTEITIRRAVG